MKKLLLLLMSVCLLCSLAYAEKSTADTEAKAKAEQMKAKTEEMKAKTEEAKTEGQEKAKSNVERAKAVAAKMEKKMAEETPDIVTKESGLRYQDLVVGDGREAIMGSKVSCHYTLWLADSTGLEKKGDTVDSSHDRNQPFDCQLGYRLIEGWSEGMVGMKEGGKRLVYVPWKLGYGERGSGARIPGKSNLIFEMELLKVKEQ